MPPFRLSLESLHTTPACPLCGAAESACYGPRTRYECGSSTYDGLKATFLPGPRRDHRAVAPFLRAIFGFLLHLCWTRLRVYTGPQWDLEDAGLKTLFAVHLRTVNSSRRLFALTSAGFRR